MKLWLVRGAVLLGLLALAAVLRHFLAPLGLAWTVYATLGLIAVVMGGELLLQAARRSRERADWRRWRRAVLEPALRPAAAEELGAALEAARKRGGRTRLRQARLAIALAELRLADDRGDEATLVLSRVPVAALERKAGALVRLARAQAYLFRGDVEGAQATLVAVDEVIGDAALDATQRLVRASLALVEGDAPAARDAAEAVVDVAHPDDDLYAEACLVAAAAERTEGPAGDAAARLDRIPDPARARALCLASSRARALLGEA